MNIFPISLLFTLRFLSKEVDNDISVMDRCKLNRANGIHTKYINCDHVYVTYNSRNIEAIYKLIDRLAEYNALISEIASVEAQIEETIPYSVQTIEDHFLIAIEMALHRAKNANEISIHAECHTPDERVLSRLQMVIIRIQNKL